MPGKPSLGALLHIYSPRYVKSGPGDLPERPEKSPTLWGPLTRILHLLKASCLYINKHTVKTNPTHAVCVHTKLNSQPVSIIIWRNIPVINLLYVLNVTIRHLWRVILTDICWHIQVKSPLHVHIVPTGLGKRATLPNTRRFVNMPQSQQFELCFRQPFLYFCSVWVYNFLVSIIF